jgi:Rrf2 family transcriptional regulator, cysteine metabolism repressor
MKVTYKGDYALKAILDLSLHYGSELVSSHDLAKRIDAPIKFLERILLDLKNGGFVESRRGKVGGYLLARDPAEITVGDIVRCIEGPTEPIACTKHGYSECRDVYKCLFRQIWQELAQATSDIIDRITFAELASRAGRTKHVMAYSI